MKKKNQKSNIKSNRFTQALNLPSLCNLNPRSVYNKRDEFHNFSQNLGKENIFLLMKSLNWKTTLLSQMFTKGGGWVADLL